MAQPPSKRQLRRTTNSLNISSTTNTPLAAMDGASESTNTGDSDYEGQSIVTDLMTRKRKRSVKAQRADQRTAAGRVSKSASKGDSDYGDLPTIPVIDSTTGKSKGAVKAEDADPRIITSGKGARNFGSLSASATYSDLKSLLQAHSAISESRNKLRKLPIEAVITLSINDFACRENAVGCIGHNPNYEYGTVIRMIHFAYRARTARQISAWKTFTPIHRLNVSNISAGWHWQSSETRVLPLRVLPFTLRPRFYVFGKDLESAKQSCTGAVILHDQGRLWFLSMKDLLGRMVEYPPGKTSIDRDFLLVGRNMTRKEQKRIAQDWLAGKELKVGRYESLEEVLLRRLQEAIRDDDLTSKWSDERNLLLPSGSSI